MLEPRVSILMACYNGERFIDRSFKSILAQTWPNIELVFIDDGSTDNSLIKAKSYTSQFSQRNYCLQIIHQNNQGFCAAAANAAKKATGKYLQLLDVDDMIMPDSCRIQAEFLEMNPNCNVVRTNGYIVPEGHLDLLTTPIEKHPETIKSNIFIDLIKGHINNWAGAYMVRTSIHRKFYDTHIFPISRYGQNLQFLLPQVVDSPSGFIDKPLFRYIRYSGSHSNQPSYEKQMENLQGYWDIRRRMLKILAITDNNIINICEISYLRRAISIAIEFNRNAEYHSHYTELKRLKGINLELRTQHSVRCGSIFQYCLRLGLFIKNYIIK